jgi:hypothetical protein
MPVEEVTATGTAGSGVVCTELSTGSPGTKEVADSERNTKRIAKIAMIAKIAVIERRIVAALRLMLTE